MPAKSKPKSKLKPTSPPPEEPSWPHLRALPPDAQSLTSLLPSQILTTPLLPRSLCATYRAFLATLPLLRTPPPKRDEATRVNSRFQTTSAAFAASLWHDTGLATLVTSGCVDGEPLDASARAALFGGAVVGLSPNIRVYRYAAGEFFGPHYDDAGPVDMPDGTRGRTTWTLLVYLSGPETGCQGGETVFYPDAPRKGERPAPVVAGLGAGLALLHRHGRECMLHEGREVTAGEKWVLRSDLVVRA